MSFKNMPDIGSGITAEQLQSMTPEETKQWRKREKEKDVKKKQLAKRLKVNSVNQENRYFKSITIKENDEVELIMNEKVFMGVNNETGKEIWKSIPISVGPIPYGANKDLKKAMKDLTTHALALYGFPDASIKDTTISSVSVSGEIENHTGRVLMTMGNKVAMCIGLNPSTGNEHSNDRTISFLIQLLRFKGYNGLIMCNLFTNITSKPKELPILKSEQDIQTLLDYSQESTDVFFCWGTFREAQERAMDVIPLFPMAKCFGWNMDKTRSPKHPAFFVRNGAKNYSIIPHIAIHYYQKLKDLRPPK